jgi:hypothetical protein
MDLTALGKLAIWTGLGIAAFGLLLVAAGKGYYPRLPGDFSFRLGNVRFFLPLATSILLSLVLTLLLNVFRR